MLPNGERVERVPAWIKRVTQDLTKSPVYDGIHRVFMWFFARSYCSIAVYWDPPVKYRFKHPAPPKITNLRIYEAHGMIRSYLTNHSIVYTILIHI